MAMRRIWKRICRKPNVISAKNVGLPISHRQDGSAKQIAAKLNAD